MGLRLHGKTAGAGLGAGDSLERLWKVRLKRRNFKTA